MKLNCSVIDDEPIARSGIIEYINKFNELQLIESGENVVDAENILFNNSIDILFIDIDMPGINGYEWVKNNEINNTLIVFITAYSEYAIGSYEFNTFDYLLKPVSFNRFKKTIEKALEYKNGKKINLNKKNLFLKAKGALQNININDIVHVSAMQNYVKLHLINNTNVTVHLTMKNVFELLKNNDFIMIHKSFLININYIDRIKNNKIITKNNIEIPIGRIYKQNLIQFIE